MQVQQYEERGACSREPNRLCVICVAVLLQMKRRSTLGDKNGDVNGDVFATMLFSTSALIGSPGSSPPVVDRTVE